MSEITNTRLVNPPAVTPQNVLPAQNQLLRPFAALDRWQLDVDNPIRRVGVNIGLVFLFCRFSVLHEALGVKFGTSFYMLYWLGLPTLVALLMSGGVILTLRSRSSWWWVAFSIWLVGATLCSTWRGASYDVVSPFFRTEVILLFVIAGLVMTWKECWRLLNVLALAALTDLVMGRYFGMTTSAVNRLQIEMEQGSLSDPNDFAAHLLLLLPFLLMIAFTPRRLLPARLFAIACTLYGVYMILSTGSRGALVALVVGFIYVIARLHGKYRFVVLVTTLLTAACFAVTLPRVVLIRLVTLLSVGNVANAQEFDVEDAAAGSAAGRKYLILQGLSFTARHPLFGVGPGEFADNEGKEARSRGERGSWHAPHNTYIEVSSETGIPGFIFFMMAIASSYHLLNRAYRRAREQPPTIENQKIVVALVCMLTSIVLFCAAIFFLSLAYKFYLPAIGGLAIAVSRAVEHEWSRPIAMQGRA